MAKALGCLVSRTILGQDGVLVFVWIRRELWRSRWPHMLVKIQSTSQVSTLSHNVKVWLRLGYEGRSCVFPLIDLHYAVERSVNELVFAQVHRGYLLCTSDCLFNDIVLSSWPYSRANANCNDVLSSSRFWEAMHCGSLDPCRQANPSGFSPRSLKEWSSAAYVPPYDIVSRCLVYCGTHTRPLSCSISRIHV